MRSAKRYTSGIAIVSMLHSYSIQSCTIGSFSATARLLVKILSLAHSLGCVQ